MDDLAAAAEVSRRTLFNYFPSKLDAVLGDWPLLDDEDFADFRAGGPQGDLLLDLRTLVVQLLEDEEVDREAVAVGRRILLSTPKLMGLVHQRYEDLSATIIEQVVAREGELFSKARAKVAVTLLAAMLDSALDAFLVDPDDRPIAYHFDESLMTARSLLGS